MKHWTIFILLTAILSLTIWSCSDDNDNEPVVAKSAIEKTVVVVLPMENGLDAHWKRIFTLLEHKIEMAFSLQDKTVRLNI